MSAEPLLEVRNLKKYFPIRKGIFSRLVGEVKAVDDISFTVYPNETVGLVGESGCGKTTAGRTLLRLLDPTAGEVIFKGKRVFELSDVEMRRVRRSMQIIFQDPYSSLNPRMTIESIIGEAIEFHGIAKGDARRKMVEDLLVRVGLQPSYITRYPHEFSGGQRQRIGIARALALNPDFIVCDEAVSALDVSVQAQVINLLQDLQQEYSLSYLFIAHDLSVVKHISDRVAVMYLGQIAEMADCDALFANPLHPYTQALLSAIPRANPRTKAKRIILKGDVPSPINPPSGCRFHTRCPACFAPCSVKVPKVHEPEPGHLVRCHLYDPDERPSDVETYRNMPSVLTHGGVPKLAVEGSKFLEILRAEGLLHEPGKAPEAEDWSRPQETEVPVEESQDSSAKPSDEPAADSFEGDEEGPTDGDSESVAAGDEGESVEASKEGEGDESSASLEVEAGQHSSSEDGAGDVSEGEMSSGPASQSSEEEDLGEKIATISPRKTTGKDTSED